MFHFFLDVSNCMNLKTHMFYLRISFSSGPVPSPCTLIVLAEGIQTQVNPWISCMMVWMLVASHSIDFFRRIKAIREGGDPGQTNMPLGPCSHIAMCGPF